MEKIVQYEIIRKGLLGIFVLIATIMLFIIVVGLTGGAYYIYYSMYTYIIIILLMIIFAIITKYVGDILILTYKSKSR